MQSIQGYPYLYETHLHTRPASACANDSGYEMAHAAHEMGYAGIIVTDHNWGGNSGLDRALPWEEWVTAFASGYRDAKRYADTHDFDVFFGYEAGFSGTEFLIYGVTPEWMIAHPELREMGLEDHLRLVQSAGGIAIHAHPYREEWYIPEIRLFPELVDGVEAVNATHSSHLSTCHNVAAYDERAIAYAREHDLPMSAGSDIHSTRLFGGGVAFAHRLRSIGDFISAIKNRTDYVLTNGDEVFTNRGEKIGRL